MTRRRSKCLTEPIPDDVLWLWGRMRDFERDGFFTKDAKNLVRPMTEPMRADVARIAPLLVEFFGKLGGRDV